MYFWVPIDNLNMNIITHIHALVHAIVGYVITYLAFVFANDAKSFIYICDLWYLLSDCWKVNALCLLQQRVKEIACIYRP